jgi:Ni,Fe-hydrogenase I small subunit
MATTLAATLTKGSPTLSHTTCFGCGQEGHWKRDCLWAKVTRAQSISHQEENILKCAHNAIKAIIGLKTVNLNIMLMGNL